MSGPRFDGKAVAVTGAGAGMGRAIAIGFAAAGASVAIGDVNASSLAETERAITEAGGTCRAQATDVRREEQVERLVGAAVQAFGKLDVMVNNAGVTGEWKPIADQDADNMNLVFDVNIKGPVFGMKHALKAMTAAGTKGVIVNIASVQGFRVLYPGAAFYAASKAAIVSLTRAAALEYGPQGIRVVALAPGAIDTPMLRAAAGNEWPPAIQNDVPLGRIGAPEEIAAAVMWLASDSAGYISGATLPVDGGFLAP